MLPVIAIIGRPNVGKSTLFNYLTQTRNALVADFPGVTRDRQYGRGVIGEHSYWIVDTGGIAEMDELAISKPIDKQVWQAIEEADYLLFLVDGKDGLMAADQIIAGQLRPYREKIFLVVNKVDRLDAAEITAEFYPIGMGTPYAIAAKNGRGVEELMEKILTSFPSEEAAEQELIGTSIHVIVMGRPNVGKSTLINRILGEERVVVFDQPGTTRDSIFIPFERRGQCYTLIDTAGVRRRSKIEVAIEKFSVIKTLQALEKAHVAILVVNAREGLTDQDLHLLGLILASGRGMIIAINKWDGLSEYERERIKQEMERRLQFVDFARRYLISALYGTGVGDLYRAIDEAYASATKSLSTSLLTEVLQQAVTDHQPPLSKGRRIRLRYAHLGKHNPLTIVVHGKQAVLLPGSYRRYLANYFRQSFNLVGVPVQIILKNDSNPYKLNSSI